VAEYQRRVLEGIVKPEDALLQLRGSYMPAMCVRCDAPMKIRTIIATQCAQPVDDIVYACPSCGIKTKVHREAAN
jgi:predicted amidophosphoribosyltransferase